VPEYCQFQITGITPQLTKGEALVAAKGFRATGRKEIPESAKYANGNPFFLRDSCGSRLHRAAVDLRTCCGWSTTFRVDPPPA
jgi:hypothetical protein